MKAGKAIKTARTLARIKQGVLSEKLGITQTYLSLIENEKKTPSLGLLERISKELFIPLPMLLWFGMETSDVMPIDRIPIYSMRHIDVEYEIRKFCGIGEYFYENRTNSQKENDEYRKNKFQSNE